MRLLRHDVHDQQRHAEILLRTLRRGSEEGEKEESAEFHQCGRAYCGVAVPRVPYIRKGGGADGLHTAIHLQTCEARQAEGVTVEQQDVAHPQG